VGYANLRWKNPHLRAGRFPTNAGNDPNYERALEKVTRIRPRIIFAHFRKATIGGKSIANTQPLVNSHWSFGHNGTIWSPAINRIENETDSGAYFRRLLDDLPPRSSRVEDTLSDTLKELRHDISLHPDDKRRTYSSLTCILSDGKSIYVVRDIANENDEDYHTMYYSVLDNGVVICQEKIIESNWNSIPNRTLVAFHGGEIKTLSCQ
jgi:predicted glutamine amidotransferase